MDSKRERRKAFMNFLGLDDDELKTRDGIYYSKEIEFGNYMRSAKLIFLDTRTHRDDHIIPSIGQYHLPFTALLAAFIRLLYCSVGYGKNYDGDILGEEQWRWLESELKNSDSSVHIIVSSIQISTTNPIVESWGHFPSAKLRLLDVLKKTDPAGVIFLTGDVHHAEISRILYNRSNGDSDYWPEFTSSGLTHTCADNRLTKLICPVMLRQFADHRLNQNGYFIARNFGLINISEYGTDIAQTVVKVDVSVRSLTSEETLSHSIEIRGCERTQNSISSIEVLHFPVINAFNQFIIALFLLFGGVFCFQIIRRVGKGFITLSCEAEEPLKEYKKSQ